MKKYAFDDIEKEGLVLYQFYRGSQTYGTSTPESDWDEGGVFLEPTNQVIGLGLDFQDQIQDEKHDKVWYSLKKYLNLLCTSNPNMLESLFVDDEFVIYEHPIITEIKKHRQEFVTKECFNAFIGYSITQIQRARGLNKKIVNPIEKRLWPLDFCFVPYKQGSSNIREWLKHRGLEQKYCGLVSINNMPGCYGVYYDWGAHNSEKYKDYGEFESDEPYYSFVESTFDDPYIGDIETFVMGEWFDKHQKPIGYRGIVREDGNSDDVRCSSVERDIRPIVTMCYNQNGFESHCRKWKEYQDWLKKRNPVRYESNLGHNYDCYLDEETEFLTKSGWKKYDEITEDDLIATFDNTHTIKWEHYLDRYENIYSGPMYTLETSYTRCTVTPNHRMHISHSPRSLKTGFKCIYNEGVNKWENIPIDEWINKRDGHYFIVNNLQNANPDNPNYTDDELLVLGYFLSDGTIGYNNGKTEYISISQLEKTKGFPLLRELSSKGILREYSFERKGRLEYSFHCSDGHIISMVNECIGNGHYSFQKSIPLFAFDLSKRQFDILLKGMMMGDGTFHKKGHWVYYTTSKQMASDLHTLLTLNGYNSQVYGKENSSYDKTYKNALIPKVRVTYRVFISQHSEQFKPFAKRKIGTGNNKNCGYAINDVKDKRIVCFTMQSGNLVTRNKNKIAFHGNSKNVMHCFRLMNMGLEIAKTGEVHVNRKGIDADFLLDVRNHKFEYDYLIDLLESRKAELDEAIANSTLPDTISREFVNSLLVDIRRKTIHFND